jgi:acyl-CoA ligase (AMP-forming) (exosortase A-associated)
MAANESLEHLPMTVVFVDDILSSAASTRPDKTALIDPNSQISYEDLNRLVNLGVTNLKTMQIAPNSRVAVRAEKTIHTVAAFFSVWRAGAILVPLNPGLKGNQVDYILNDCHASLISDVLALFKQQEPARPELVTIEQDRHQENAPACILYTSGSTGMPKGVVLSHRNLVAGAISVASYLENTSSDNILAALPLSFDAGLSQLTTGFLSAATIVLHQYLFAQDCLRLMERERITGFTGVPPMWIQLSELVWPPGASKSLRYFANTGGKMPLPTLNLLREKAPQAKPYLMYGLTEAFRSTYLSPDQVDARPNSIGKAIPNAQVLVLRPDGSESSANEPGELVHIGPTVTLGYWNDPERTSQRFRPVTNPVLGMPFPIIGVWSGDTVTRDEKGYLYFVGRTDEMIKTSGYRVSPTEVEEAVYRTGLISECVAFGVEDYELGQAIHLIGFHAVKEEAELISSNLKKALRNNLPMYMMPKKIILMSLPLGKNANGKLDRRKIIQEAKR